MFSHLITVIKKVRFVKAVVNGIGASGKDIFRLAGAWAGLILYFP